jgi:hypothetical protein
MPTMRPASMTSRKTIISAPSIAALYYKLLSFVERRTLI